MSAQPDKIQNLCLIAIVGTAALLRLWYAFDLPLSGDEVGVGVLQASGQATTYTDHLPNAIVSLRTIRGFIEYNPAFSPSDVLRSLRFAGMHPPLYYVILHYLMRLFGNDALTLRLFSIAVSSASILALYCLGRALHGQTVGIAAALLLAVAPYGVTYGSLVRPYPLAMLLALLSTVMAVHLARRSDLFLRKLTVLAYLTVSILGAYTVYQFAFVLLCQFVYLTLSHLRNTRNLIVLATTACFAGASYIPWLPSLALHLSDITSHQYYFHQSLDLWRFVRGLIVLNSGVFDSAQPELMAALIGIPTCLALSIGMYGLWNEGRTRSFVIALAVYLGFYIGVERLLHVSTLAEPKFLFFVIPICFLIASVGIVHAFKNNTQRVVVLCCGASLLGISSVITCADRDRLSEDTDERYVRDFAPILNGDGHEKLLLINTLQRRYLFSLVHALHPSGDAYILRETAGGVDMPGGEALRRYRRLYLVNLYVDYEPETFLSAEKLDAVTEVLRSRNFHVIESLTSGTGAQRHSLLVFAPDVAVAPVHSKESIEP